MGNVVFLLEKLMGIHVCVYGDAQTKASEKTMLGERALWMANHRTRIDWMLLWSVALRTRTLHQMKIVLKAPLRKIPIFGWAMQHFVFIFLQRQWADDQIYLHKLLSFLTTREPEASYLIFPEGTDLSESNRDKSNSFAAKTDLPPREYSLYPRTTGWTFMYPLLREHVAAVYDITMFYVDHSAKERPSEASLLSGRMPRMIHFYIERVPIQELEKEQDQSEWVQARFKRKEEMLKAFYEQNGKLPEGAQRMFERDQSTTFALLLSVWLLLIFFWIEYVFAWGVWGWMLGLAVVAGYHCSTRYLSGVDGYLVDTL